MRINSRSVRIQAGRIEIEKALQNGSDVMLQVDGSVIKEEHIDNHDGTEDIVYIVKGFIVESK